MRFTEVGELSLNVIVYILLITIFNYFIISQIIIKIINLFCTLYLRENYTEAYVFVHDGDKQVSFLVVVLMHIIIFLD